jgi:hypothetical protein
MGMAAGVNGVELAAYLFSGGTRTAFLLYNSLIRRLAMKRVSVDTAPSAVKKFIRTLAIDANGVEVTLSGNVVCRIIPPRQLSDADTAAKLAEMRKLLGKARAKSKHVPAALAERHIRNALKAVRGGG